MAREGLSTDDTKRVKWIFKALYLESDRLTPRDLETAASIESQFLVDGKLSKPQLDLLEVLYERYS